LDQARNLIVAISDAIVAIGGGGGTLSEIAYAWSLKRLIIAFDLPGWSGLLADKIIDKRIRYPEITEDIIFRLQTVLK
jgi:predicted Rossmann-fold nucleotide-binding protein